MKINTNQCKALKDAPESFLNQNHFIPASRLKEEHETKEHVAKDDDSKAAAVKSTDTAVVPDKVSSEIKHPIKKENDNTPKKDDEDNKQDEAGRQVKYQTSIVYTPVLSSKRNEESSRTIDKEDIDVLQAKLEDLFVSPKAKKHSSSSKKEKKDTAESKLFSPILVTKVIVKMEPSKDNKVPAETRDEDNEPKESTKDDQDMGRVQSTVFNYRTCLTSPVKRSARIASQS